MKRFMAFLCVLFLFFTITTPSIAETPFFIEQLTFDSDPGWFQINDNTDVVWYASDGDDDEIFLYDGSTKLTSQVTNNSLTDRNPDINTNGDIVWQSYDSSVPVNSYDVYVRYKGSTPLHITNDNLRQDTSPQINDNGVIVWSARSGSNLATSEIFKYDGSLTRLTNNDYADQQVSISSNGDIVWNFNVGGTNEEIWLNDPTAAGNISNHTFVDNYPVINSNGDIVWGGTHYSPDIYLYDGATKAVTNLTSGTTGDAWPDIGDNGDVVWERGNEIILYDSMTQTSGVIVASETSIYNPRINEAGDIVWAEYRWIEDDELSLWYLLFYDASTEELTTLATCSDGFDYWEINSKGDVAWLADDGVSSELYIASQVPIPGAVWLLGSGLIGIVGIRKKIKK